MSHQCDILINHKEVYMDKNNDLAKKINNNVFNEIINLIDQARHKVVVTINEQMILLYWNIGMIIKEKIIKNRRSKYGKKIIPSLSKELANKYGKGFSAQNLWYMLNFYQEYPILQSMIGEFKGLSWTHIITLLPIKDKLKRNFYTTLCLKEIWSVRILKDKINSMLYERTTLSKLPEKTIENQLKELKSSNKMTPEIIFRDPYVLDFLELKDTYSEKDLEMAILNSLEKFILELGKNFHFVTRQKRITIDNEDYYIDLLFYHRILRCYIVIELKLGKFKSEYKGQMELYLSYLEKYEMMKGENPPIGLILCSEKGKEQVELLFIPKDRIKVAEYLTTLPPKKVFAEKLHKAIKNAKIEL